MKNYEENERHFLRFKRKKLKPIKINTSFFSLIDSLFPDARSKTF